MLFSMFAALAPYFRHLRDSEKGQGLVEYALILSLVSIAALAVLAILGVDVSHVLDTVENALDGNDAAPIPDPAAAPAP